MKKKCQKCHKECDDTLCDDCKRKKERDDFEEERRRQRDSWPPDDPFGGAFPGGFPGPFWNPL